MKTFKGLVRNATDAFEIARDRVFPREATTALPHLGAEVVISLTSYPPRFASLHLTLNSLLSQQPAADRVILWIASGDMDRLPLAVTSLQNDGLTIQSCNDLRSYKKLLPALELYPDAIIVTADDDHYYRSDWLYALVSAFDVDYPAVVGARVHRITMTSSGNVAPYRDWESVVRDDRSLQPSSNLMPTGVGGVLYPPNCFDARVHDYNLARSLAPSGDDLWFFWMARLAGTRYRRCSQSFRQILWSGSQNIALQNINLASGNDIQIIALEKHFGNPCLMP